MSFFVLVLLYKGSSLEPFNANSNGQDNILVTVASYPFCMKYIGRSAIITLYVMLPIVLYVCVFVH